MPLRLKFALSYYYQPLKNILIWLIKSKEDTNFTYDLDDLNKKYLASFISVILNANRSRIMEYMAELDQDDRLKQHIAKITASSSRRYAADTVARYGTRMGWYAMIREKKPKVVVETGVDKGIGACVIAAALMKNEEEGHKGYYYGTDINEGSGYLFKEPYNKYGKILYGDSIESLQRLDVKIDMFVHYVFHSAEYELAEYEAVKGKCAENALIMSARSHVDSSLLDFAEKTDRNFLFFSEKPKSHWYPGAGLGVAFDKR